MVTKNVEVRSSNAKLLSNASNTKELLKVLEMVSVDGDFRHICLIINTENHLIIKNQY